MKGPGTTGGSRVCDMEKAEAERERERETEREGGERVRDR